MYITHDFYIGFRDVDFKNNLKLKGMLSYLEDSGGIHGNVAKYGLLDIPRTHLSWVLLNWKVKFIKRPQYADTVTVRTWSCGMDKIHAIRDFEVTNQNGDQVAIASSKWVLIDTEKMKISRLNDAVMNAYTIENEKIFDDDFDKLQEPKNGYSKEIEVILTSDMMDVNGHVHNINYMDFASQILPVEVMENTEWLEILYKKEIRFDSKKVKVKYAFEEGYHYAVIKSEDEEVLHCIIRIKSF